MNPALRFEDVDLVLAVQFIAALPDHEFVECQGTLVHESDRVVRAIDALLSGI